MVKDPNILCRNCRNLYENPTSHKFKCSLDSRFIKKGKRHYVQYIINYNLVTDCHFYEERPQIVEKDLSTPARIKHAELYELLLKQGKGSTASINSYMSEEEVEAANKMLLFSLNRPYEIVYDHHWEEIRKINENLKNRLHYYGITVDELRGFGLNGWSYDNYEYDNLLMTNKLNELESEV